MNTPIQQEQPERMVRFSVFLDRELREELERYSAQTGVPFAECIRRGTSSWLEKQRERDRSLA